MNGAAALVMAKAARAGYVKTRLRPLLGDDGCARLQAALTRHALAWACAVAPGAAFAAFAPREAEEEIAALAPCAARLFAQPDGPLGARLAHATQHVFAAGAGSVVVAGTDCPALGTAHAERALATLAAGADVCFGPALDGGYYLVALARPLPALFDLPAGAWGGPAVLESSLRLAERAGATVALIEPERDLDDAADARALIEHPATPPDVAELLSSSIAAVGP